MTRGHWQRRLATGANAVLVAIFVVVAAFFLAELASRFRTRVDLSSDQVATLQNETLDALTAADAAKVPITITAFSAQQKGEEAWFRDRTMQDFLREVDLRSESVTTRFVDFDADRLTAEQLGVNRYGAVVVEGRGDRIDLKDREIFRRRPKAAEGEPTLEFLGEVAITRAINQILAGRPQVLYFLEGHGERSIDDHGPTGLGDLVAALETQGFTVKSLDIVRDAEDSALPSVPADAAAVVVVGPTTPMSSVEDSVLREYLGRGGRLAVFVDPGGVLPGLFSELGVSVQDGFVEDLAYYFPHVDRPQLRYSMHEVTEDLIESKAATMVAHAAPIVTSKVDGVLVQPLLSTSRRGWIEKSTDPQPVFDEGTDTPGPVDVAVALTIAPPSRLAPFDGSTRALVVGDVDMLLPELLAEGAGNKVFVVAAIRSLLGDEARSTRVGRPSNIRRVTLSNEQLTMVRWLVLGLLPLCIIVVGILVWWTRRGR